MNTFFYYRFGGFVFAIATYCISPFMDISARAGQDALPSIQRPTSPHPTSLAQPENHNGRVSPFDLIIEKEKKTPEGMTSWRNGKEAESHDTEREESDVENRIKNAVQQMHADEGAEPEKAMMEMEEQHKVDREQMTASQKALVEKFSQNKNDQVKIDLKSWEPTKTLNGSYSSQATRQEKTNGEGLEMPKRLWSVD